MESQDWQVVLSPCSASMSSLAAPNVAFVDPGHHTIKVTLHASGSLAGLQKER